VLAKIVVLGISIGSVCLIVLGSTQAKDIAEKPTTMHASLAAYPGAIISLRDPKTGMIFYVESNGLRLVALSKAGIVVWGIDVFQEAKIVPALGKPVIRHLKLEGDTLWVTCGKNDTVKVQAKTGKTEYAGAD